MIYHFRLPVFTPLFPFFSPPLLLPSPPPPHRKA